MSISNLLTSGAQAGADLSITCHNVICDAESVFEAGLRVDNIAEYTADNGVSIDGVLLKNGGLTCGAISSGTASMIGAPVNGIDLCNKDYVDAIAGGGGDVVGAASSTDNAVARFNLATGKVIQNSAVIIDDNGIIDTPRFIRAVNPDTAAASYFTNDFRRGTGAAAPAWIAAQFGANAVSAGITGDRVIIGNYLGELTIGGHNDGHSAWRPLYIGQNTAGASLNLRGIDVPITTTNGVSISSTVQSTSTASGSLTTLGGVGIAKALYCGGTINGFGKAVINSDLTLGTDATSAHLHTKGATPTISATHTIQSWSTDIAGEITVAASSTATITFGVAYTGMLGMAVVLTPKTAGAGAYYVGATSTTTFTAVNVVASPITFMYYVIAGF